MDFTLQPGRYVVAVSGGVDSVALLHLLAQQPDLQLTIAHFDHGIRPDSAEDRRLVQALAREHGMPFVYHEGRLGGTASEAAARQARYDFLHRVRAASGAEAIVTAHHQDDLLETVILNLLRGTGRRGLSSLKSTDVIKRPLLRVPKKELLRYAERKGLLWREDSTNADERYMRNYIRRRILSRFADSDREALLALIKRAAELNEAIDKESTAYLHLQPAQGVLDRHSFTMLPHAVAREVMAEWLLRRAGAELSRKMLERLVIAAKTGRAGTRVDINKEYWLKIDCAALALEHRER
ncbi:MAG TPA: tRNA lysidine(34) synthetase TilS [Candidatus Saccharimonadales bacterium]|jgi:tRNA(Ile)-lysidine synthase